MSDNVGCFLYFHLFGGHGWSFIYVLSVARYLHLFDLDPDDDTTNNDFKNSYSAESRQNKNGN